MATKLLKYLLSYPTHLRSGRVDFTTITAKPGDTFLYTLLTNEESTSINFNKFLIEDYIAKGIFCLLEEPDAEPTEPVVPSGTAPHITVQPTNTSVTSGTDAAFTVTATGTATLTYDWYVNTTGVNAHTDTLTVSTSGNCGMVDAQNGDVIYVIVTNAWGHEESNHVTLTVT